jgi:hypothetical protein
MEDEDEIYHAWERFIGNPLRELLPLEVEFGELLLLKEWILNIVYS